MDDKRVRMLQLVNDGSGFTGDDTQIRLDLVERILRKLFECLDHVGDHDLCNQAFDFFDPVEPDRYFDIFYRLTDEIVKHIA